MEPKKPRLLGRGVPPSQPVPQHLAPASLDNADGPKPPRPVIIAAAVALGLLAFAIVGALLWQSVLTPKPPTTAPALSGFVRETSSADPIDVAVKLGSPSSACNVRRRSLDFPKDVRFS